MDYVIALCQREDHVLVVLKDRPEWQKGKLNLPGGKIEEGETPEYAALREVIEETGLNPWLDPYLMGYIQDGPSRIFCLKVVVGADDLKPQEGETEEIFWMPMHKMLEDPRLIPNLKLIVPLMRCGVTNWIINDGYRSSEGSYHSIEIAVPTGV